MGTDKNTVYQNSFIILNDLLVQHIDYLFTLVDDVTIEKGVRDKILKSLIVLNHGIGEFQKQALSILINIDMNYPKH